MDRNELTNDLRLCLLCCLYGGWKCKEVDNTKSFRRNYNGISFNERHVKQSA